MLPTVGSESLKDHGGGGFSKRHFWSEEVS